ncbi:MAG TPA: Fe-Mn family superoxide dismutase [Thermoanaerobaculia bacterium]
MTYKARQFNLSGLNGISDETLEMHFTLYEGYVNETNNLDERIAELTRETLDPAKKAHFSELKRRHGFECNGMVLHELYFENLKRDGGGEPVKRSSFRGAIETSFGEYAKWKSDFVNVGMMRGIGWAICYLDPRNGRVSNHWIEMHETNHIAGFAPVLVMDVWEHAYLKDYKPAEKNKYIDAFFSNLNWDLAEQRMTAREALAAAR